MDGMVFLDACPIGFSSRDASISRYDIGSPTKSAACFPEGSTSTEYVPVLASSMAGGDVSVPHHITEGLLYRIICRFKEGHVFSADEYGVFEKRFNLRQSDLATKTPFDESDSASDPDAGEFLQHFPAARSIIFLPMWHFQKEKWFAAAIGWTCDSTQCFELGDATYLNAFANSIMAEVLRLEALAVSKAKSDFISSISHELRSPLHGILATTELLRESITSPEDRSLLEMVSSSGSTLLDTMDHLLEHAKINGLAVGRAGRSIKDRRRKRSDREATSALLLCNLAELVEGVVQDAVMGYSRHSVTQGSLSSIIPGAAMPASEQEPPPIVTINIQTGANWNMTLEVGAWKRIILNLVGNALKYTPSGSIEISLTMSERSGDNEVLLAVRDTGIGMSDDYQKYHLFSPFRQENPLSVGTGLGLSIVQQIVDMQGGKIGVKSQQGVGTLVTVAVPVPRTTFPSDVPTSTPMRDIKRLKGLRIGILRHSGRYAVDEESYEQQHTLLHHHKILGVSIASIAHDWFGVDTNIIASLDDHNFDILLLDQALDPLEHVALQTQPLSSKAIVVVRDSQAHKQHPQQIGTTLMLPVGPRRLAQVLLDALDLSQARAESSKQQVALPDVFASIPSDVNDRDILRDLPVPEVQARLSSPALLPTPPESTTPVDTSNGLPKPDVEQSPTQDMDASLSKLSTADQAHSQSSSPYVLIVDDNSVNVRILTTLVSRLNCPHLTASNGLEALQLYTAMYNSQKPFDMVLMDINMPVMDGYASTREIRAFEASQGVSKPSQIIALTGLGNSDSEREAARSGMDLFLTKPVKLDKLRALLGGEMHK
jgi:signal transduction histidine kinase/ActR/RegA family two-component response regulator